MGELLVLILIGVIIVLGFIVLIFFLLNNKENNVENYGIENKLFISSIENEFVNQNTEKVIELMIELLNKNPKIEEEKAYRNLVIMLEDSKLKHKVNLEYTFKVFRLVRFINLKNNNQH